MGPPPPRPPPRPPPPPPPSLLHSALLSARPAVLMHTAIPAPAPSRRMHRPRRLDSTARLPPVDGAAGEARPPSQRAAILQRQHDAHPRPPAAHPPPLGRATSQQPLQYEAPHRVSSELPGSHRLAKVPGRSDPSRLRPSEPAPAIQQSSALHRSRAQQPDHAFAPARARAGPPPYVALSARAHTAQTAQPLHPDATSHNSPWHLQPCHVPDRSSLPGHRARPTVSHSSRPQLQARSQTCPGPREGRSGDHTAPVSGFDFAHPSPSSRTDPSGRVYKQHSAPTSAANLSCDTKNHRRSVVAQAYAGEPNEFAAQRKAAVVPSRPYTRRSKSFLELVGLSSTHRSLFCSNVLLALLMQ